MRKFYSCGGCGVRFGLHSWATTFSEHECPSASGKCLHETYISEGTEMPKLSVTVQETIDVFTDLVRQLKAGTVIPSLLDIDHRRLYKPNGQARHDEHRIEVCWTTYPKDEKE